MLLGPRGLWVVLERYFFRSMEAAAPIIRSPTTSVSGRQIVGNITVEVCASGCVPKTGFPTGRRVILGRRYALVSVFDSHLGFRVRFPTRTVYGCLRYPLCGPSRSLQGSAAPGTPARQAALPVKEPDCSSATITGVCHGAAASGDRPHILS